MKRYIYNALVTCSCIAALSACSENSWNDNELDGFEVPGITDVKTVEYTMTNADYASVASNSTNKSLAGDANAAALKAVGTKFCFSEQISARDYVPAFLGSSSFSYFTLSDGSAVKLTYRTSQAMPAEIAAIEAAPEYVVSDADYKEVWGSEDDYVAAFAPSHPASKEIPAILAAKYPDAAEGDFVIVNYEVSATDPVFNAPDEPEQPGFALSDVLSTLNAGDDCTVNGVVSALCVQGFVLTDASGSIFVYRGSNFGKNNYDGLKIGNQIVLNGTVSARNLSIQIDNGATIDIVGTQEVTYPAAETFDAAKLTEIIARTDNALAIYGKMTGNVKVSGTNINIIIDENIKAQGSPYGLTDDQKAMLTDGASVTITGYLINVAGSRYCNIVPTDITVAGASAATASSRAAVAVASTDENTVYTFNGTKWLPATATVALNHADYQAMGQRYDNLQDEDPALFLPEFLKQKYPYAKADDAMFVVYNYYSGTTAVRCEQYTYNGTAWTLYDGMVTETAQFVKTGGKWMYDPNVTITLPAGKGIEISTLYFQACVDWVKNNIDKPTGATYVTKYGNNEYYSGTSAFQGNVDLRASAAISQYPAGYEGMSNEEVVAKMKERFEKETFPAALSAIHPDADVIPGIDVIYTINFSAYDGATTKAYVIKYKVIAKGKFEFIECDW
ncbi:MAG: hypothetical protein K2I18_03800 [Paramuribaculum sp.]|nr:hypothetical protein [Paramuribaculum sp.]